jgi:DNA-binding IclR family transcriptional regulator
MKAGTLVKGLDLLTTLSVKASDSSLGELATAVAIDKSTAHRILAVMTSMGFVAKDETTKRYSLGAQFRALTSPNYGQLQQAALPRMRSLAQSTGVTVALRIREGKDMVVIDRVENSDLLRVSFPIGLRHPISFGGAGEAFLAFLPRSEAMRVLGRPFCERNRNFFAKLARIRNRGYAVSRGTAVKGAISVSVPILAAEERPIGVLSLSWPSAKYPSSRLRRIAEAGVKKAREISNSIHGRTASRNGKIAREQLTNIL